MRKFAMTLSETLLCFQFLIYKTVQKTNNNNNNNNNKKKKVKSNYLSLESSILVTGKIIGKKLDFPKNTLRKFHKTNIF